MFFGGEGALCCVIGKGTLLSQCLSLHWILMKLILRGIQPYNGLVSHLGEVEKGNAPG